MIKLDLGAGPVSPEGFTPMGRAHGSAVYPLPHGEATVDEIRASHLLEHFAHGQVADVLSDWVRALKPGGRLRLAVPDFKAIAERYLAGDPVNVQGYVMGGQADADDFHKTAFDDATLRKLLAAAGLVLLRRWESEIEDCARLPISLNIEGTKPFASEIKVAAVMSVPRLGFMDNFFCAFESLPQLRIPLYRHTGAFWGACLTRTIEEALEAEQPDAILTLDYDTVFRRADVARLIELMLVHPEADAIAPIQASRHRGPPLFTMRRDDGDNRGEVPCSRFAGDLTLIGSAHFGLTLLRTDKIRDLPKPWFLAVPDAEGGWGEGRTDEDISFWRRWEAAGHSLYLANRVVVGHAELMVRWPGRDLQAIHQSLTEYREAGRPKESWQ